MEEVTLFVPSLLVTEVRQEILEAAVKGARLGRPVKVITDSEDQAVSCYNDTVKLLKSEDVNFAEGPHHMMRVAQDERKGSPMLGSIRFMRKDEPNRFNMRTKFGQE